MGARTCVRFLPEVLLSAASGSAHVTVSHTQMHVGRMGSVLCANARLFSAEPGVRWGFVEPLCPVHNWCSTLGMPRVSSYETILAGLWAFIMSRLFFIRFAS